jgi:hypothetical protein
MYHIAIHSRKTIMTSLAKRRDLKSRRRMAGGRPHRTGKRHDVTGYSTDSIMCVPGRPLAVTVAVTVGEPSGPAGEPALRLAPWAGGHHDHGFGYAVNKLELIPRTRTRDLCHGT